MNPTQGDLLELAEELRDEGMARTTQADADRDGWDRKVIDQAIDELIRRNRVFSANDLRELLPEVRQPLIGARMRAAATSDRVTHVGYVKSTLPSTHAHDIKTWRASDQGEPS